MPNRRFALVCQPLLAALCVFLESFHSSALIIQT
ncbi:acetyltransferase [Vibrio fluvialis]|nr:acetyltransferase [Vibrio fluvialis]